MSKDKRKPQYHRKGKSLLIKSEGEIKIDEVKKLKSIINSTTFTIFISILTIYTIFAMDIDEGFFTKSASFYFSVVHVAAMIIFIAEVIATIKLNKQYIWQFYFWIDLFSTLAMILQLIWIQDLMSSVSNIQVAVNFARMTRVTRFAKIGARSSKIIKLIKIIKLAYAKQEIEDPVFINPNQSQCQNTKKMSIMQELKIKQNPSNEQMRINGEKKINENQKKGQITDLKIGNQKKINRVKVNVKLQAEIQQKWEAQSVQLANKNKNEPIQQIQKGSNIGQTLKYEIQKNIVIMVMGLTMIVPLLSAATWFNKTADMSLSTQIFINYSLHNPNKVEAYEILTTFLDLTQNVSNPNVYYNFNFSFTTGDSPLKVNDTTQLKTLRQAQKLQISQDSLFNIIYSKRKSAQVNSWLSIARSAFITVLLLFALIFFMKDLELYALIPLQKMNKTVKRVQKNPFSAIHEHSTEQDIDSIYTAHEEEELQLETNVLQKLLIKVASLLALGVGETPSGASKNQIANLALWKDDTGVQVRGVFMVVQIAHVQQIIQNLEGESCIYMNNILQIFHEVAIQNGGFVYHQDQTYSLLCWAIGSSFESPIQQKLEEKKNIQIALLTYIKFYEKVLKSAIVKKYQYLNRNIPQFQSYKVHVGIHGGLAFCGAIGSQHKISLRAMGHDASVAKSLCRIAKKYKLGHIFSSYIYKLSPYLQNISRKIENGKFIENQKIIDENFEIYTALLYSNTSKQNKKLRTIKLKQKDIIINEAQQKLRNRMRNIFKIRDQLLQKKESRAQQIVVYHNALFKSFTGLQQWIQNWRQSQTNYQQGQWSAARVGFQNSKEYSPELYDFPTQMRLEEINNRQQPYPQWKKVKNFSLFL